MPKKVKQPRSSKPAVSRFVVLDTNFYIRLLGKNKSQVERYTNLLEELVKSGYDVAVSDFVRFELIQGATVDHEREIITKYLADLPKLPVDQRTLHLAANLVPFYKDVAGVEIDAGDRIIASSVVMANALILTENCRDFPEPFFKEIKRWRIEYDKNGLPACSYVYLKEPDNQELLRCAELRHGEKGTRLAPPKK